MKKPELSTIRVCRIREQGYFDLNDLEIRDLAFGNRFAYRLCVSILIIGVALSNIPVLSTMMTIAFLGVVLPNHPFDYIYNELLSKPLRKPKIRPRSMQLKFACGIATLWIGGTIYLIHIDQAIASYIIGGLLIAVALLVSLIDLCIPSIIFNKVFRSVKKTMDHELKI